MKSFFNFDVVNKETNYEKLYREEAKRRFASSSNFVKTWSTFTLSIRKRLSLDRKESLVLAISFFHLYLS